jgi:hypothetical protein
MAVAPDGPESLPLKHLRALLSESSAFQSWVGVGNAAAALAYIDYFVMAVARMGVATPFAIVGTIISDGFSMEVIGRGAKNQYGANSGVALMLWAPVDAETGLDDQFMTFTNTTGTILKEMGDVAHEHFDFSRVDRVVGPWMPEDDDLQDEPRHIKAIYYFHGYRSPVE